MAAPSVGAEGLVKFGCSGQMRECAWAHSLYARRSQVSRLAAVVASTMTAMETPVPDE